MSPSAEAGLTGQLSNWIHSLKLDDVPKDVQTRGKYLILDGLACALNGAHVPWSEDAAKAVFEFEEPGRHTVFGWEEVRVSLFLSLLFLCFVFFAYIEVV